MSWASPPRAPGRSFTTPYPWIYLRNGMPAVPRLMQIVLPRRIYGKWDHVDVRTVATKNQVRSRRLVDFSYMNAPVRDDISHRIPKVFKLITKTRKVTGRPQSIRFVGREIMHINVIDGDGAEFTIVLNRQNVDRNIESIIKIDEHIAFLADALSEDASFVVNIQPSTRFSFTHTYDELVLCR